MSTSERRPLPGQPGAPGSDVSPLRDCESVCCPRTSSWRPQETSPLQRSSIFQNAPSPYNKPQGKKREPVGGLGAEGGRLGRASEVTAHGPPGPSVPAPSRPAWPQSPPPARRGTVPHDSLPSVMTPPPASPTLPAERGLFTVGRKIHDFSSQAYGPRTPAPRVLGRIKFLSGGSE